jgi:hypothetical protein
MDDRSGYAVEAAGRALRPGRVSFQGRGNSRKLTLKDSNHTTLEVSPPAAARRRSLSGERGGAHGPPRWTPRRVRWNPDIP